MKSDKNNADMQLQYREQLVEAMSKISQIERELMDLKYQTEQLEAERANLLRKKQIQTETDVFEAIRRQRQEKKRRKK